MAVYTDITEVELGAFLADYRLGELLSYRGIAEGSENSNFMVHTDAGPFILTLYEKRVEARDLPFFLGLMQHLANKGISCPLPVARNDGALIGTLAGRPAALITFLEGVWKRRPTATHCRAVGEALAGLHLAGADFPLTRRNALDIGGWRKLWEGARPRADEVEAGLVAEIDAEFATFDRNWPDDLPAGIIHADLFPDNVFFLGDALSGPSGIPVVTVHHVVFKVEPACLGEEVGDEVAQMLMHLFLGNEVTTTERNTPDAQIRIDSIFLTLILETSRDDIDAVAETRETLGQLDDENDLAARVRLSKLGFSPDVAMRRDHQNGSKRLRVFLSAR